MTKHRWEPLFERTFVAGNVPCLSTTKSVRVSCDLDKYKIAKALIDNDHDERLLASTAHCADRYGCKTSVARAEGRPWK
ncbi:hypothetical protein ACPOL_4537 [Acidisarcina polymorpha]|uniref:Uncharacterized protein n=1 Tax=Acidisarcina polymorpha TaxID=2211140 RepID=A0A2Z5G403_9BACT|nr:hypothetical protein ACPOL_4537 [Acidisarcina polymorpha]